MRAVFATIAVGMFMSNLGLEIGGPFAIKFPAPLGEDIIRIGSAVLRPQRLLVLGMTILLVVLLQLFFLHTKVGLAMRAVMLDRETAQLMGIDVRRSIALTFALSSALGAAAGILIAPIVYWMFNMGFFLGIKSFAALTLGGLYTFPGAIVGGLLMGVLESFTSLFISSTYRDVIVFSILILVLLARPQGLLGKRREGVG
jgi:branched-chain amino acid transport system permease protein